MYVLSEPVPNIIMASATPHLPCTDTRAVCRKTRVVVPDTEFTLETLPLTRETQGLDNGVTVLGRMLLLLVVISDIITIRDTASLWSTQQSIMSTLTLSTFSITLSIYMSLSCRQATKTCPTRFRVFCLSPTGALVSVKHRSSVWPWRPHRSHVVRPVSIDACNADAVATGKHVNGPSSVVAPSLENAR